MKRKQIAILGAGYAGMAAALELSQAGCNVTVFEAAKTLGGRARAVQLEEGIFDNGQHLVIGAYTELLRLMRLCGVEPDSVFLRYPFSLQIEPGFHLAYSSLPAPWHRLIGFLGLRGLGIKERVALLLAIWTIRKGHTPVFQDCTVLQWVTQIKQPSRLIQYFWEPLTLATLNTPIQKASAQALLNVLNDSLGGTRQASDLLFPRVDLSTLFPDPAARLIREQGGQIRLSTRVRSLKRAQKLWQVNDFNQDYDAIVCALPPAQLGLVLGGLSGLISVVHEIQSWEFQPISTIYLQYPGCVRLPCPMIGLVNSLSQWVFDRSWTHHRAGLFAVVISAEGPHQRFERAALVSQIQAELHAHFGFPRKANGYRVISEKRATFSCVPGMCRPTNRTPEPGLWLAGDYTAADTGRSYPATLESAVRSGVAAAYGLLKEAL